MEISCRLCTAFATESELLKEKLLTYISMLGEEEKADSALYAIRIEKCEKCKAMQQGVCSYCGCFVIVRAAKKQMSCPYPSGRKW